MAVKQRRYKYVGVRKHFRAIGFEKDFRFYIQERSIADKIDRQLTQKGGRITLHQEPGLGFAFDDDAVTRYGKWTEVR